MAGVVLDASAVLAYLQDDAGAVQVEDALGDAMISAVNLAEVVTKLADHGASEQAIGQILAALPCTVAPLDFDGALAAGFLRPLTRFAGLSLGDRACLALGRQNRLPVLTTDRAWMTLELGVDVRLIR